MPSEPLIRRATLADATHLAALVDTAAKGLASYNWRLMAEPLQSPFEVGRGRAMRETGDFSYRNGHIAELDGVVVGALVGYVIANPYDMGTVEKVPAIFRPLAELESEAAGRWYVNVLAVYPEYRGKGIGRRMLQFADAVGRVAPNGMAIIVAEQNEGAAKLYQSAGYQLVSRRPFAPPAGYHHEGDFLLLTKPHS